MLLPLGVKFVPEESDESDHDSDEEPELNQSQLERQCYEKVSQPIITNDMTPLAQPNLEHGQGVSGSKTEHEKLPVDHVENC